MLPQMKIISLNCCCSLLDLSSGASLFLRSDAWFSSCDANLSSHGVLLPFGLVNLFHTGNGAKDFQFFVPNGSSSVCARITLTLIARGALQTQKQSRVWE